MAVAAAEDVPAPAGGELRGAAPAELHAAAVSEIAAAAASAALVSGRDQGRRP
jgi:hypothetical protein